MLKDHDVWNTGSWSLDFYKLYFYERETSEKWKLWVKMNFKENEYLKYSCMCSMCSTGIRLSKGQ